MFWKSNEFFSLPGQLYGLYLLTAIITPAVLLAAFGYWPLYYTNVVVDPLRLIFIIILLLLPLFLDIVIVNPSALIRKPTKPVFINIFLVAMIAIAVFSIASGNSRWRYSDASVSEIGGIWLYFFMIMPAVGKLMALDILFLRRTFQSSLSTKILLVLMLLMTINGNMTAIFSLLVSCLLLTGANRLLFDEGREKVSFLHLLFYIAAFAVCLALVVLAYIYGESVKRGISPYDVYNWIAENLNEQAGWIKELILGRISPTLVSMLHITQENWCQSEPCRNFNFLSVLHTGLFRVLSVFGLNEAAGITKDLNGTISRINYNEISINPFNDREGTSPGLLPGFFYAFGSHLAAPIFLVYGAIQILFLKRISSLIKQKLSLAGKLLLLYLLLPLFESPVDFLLVVDDGLIYLAGLIVISCWRISVTPITSRRRMTPSMHTA